MNKKKWKAYLKWGEQCNTAAEEQYLNEVKEKERDIARNHSGVYTFMDCGYYLLTLSDELCTNPYCSTNYCKKATMNKECPRGYCR